jgi:hypothetical protein
MLIIYGVYRWKPKRVAFRNDYCLRCDAPRRSMQIRTFRVGHIFWIPLTPAGFWKDWFCTVCGRDPHTTGKTRRGFKWVGLFILLLFSGVFWAMPYDPEIGPMMWVIRVAAPAAAILTLVHLLRTKKEPSLVSRLAMIAPASDTVCPFCATPLLILASQTSCPACGVVRT